MRREPKTKMSKHKCTISDEKANEIHRQVQKAHGVSPNKKFMSVEAKDDYNKQIKQLHKKLDRICKR